VTAWKRKIRIKSKEPVKRPPPNFTRPDAKAYPYAASGRVEKVLVIVFEKNPAGQLSVCT
jgi:hypothetical protein